MFKLRRRSGGWVFVGLTVCAIFLASANPEVGEARPLAATSPSMGAAASYAVLSGAAVTNTGPTVVIGNLGISPGIGAAPHFTGFPPGLVISPPFAIHDADANAGLAQANATAAFGALSAAPNAPCDITYGPAQDLVGLTLAPGVYCFPTSAQLTTSVPLTLDGGGDPAAVWIFRMASGLNTTPGVGASVVVTNGGSACNVWWQVGSSATIGSGTNFLGNILALTSISLGTGASLEGRSLSQTGAVTLDTNHIFAPNCTPTSVELLYFRADPVGGQQVRLEWATTLEVDNFGFNLYRANVNDLAEASLLHFEPAVTQGSGSGATYFYLDTAPNDGSWWYWLADVDTQGRETLHTPANAPVKANIGSVHRVYLPLTANGVN